MDPITQPSQTSGAPSGEDDAPVGATVEERDAYWRKRMSGKDRAHSAAEQALRDQIASFEARLKAAPATGQDGQPGNESAAEIARLQREIEQRDTLYGRKVKYPNLAGKVSDATIMSSDEADLARFNELFAEDTTPTGGVIAPTQPRRGSPVQPKRIEDMSKDELLVALDRESRKMVEARQGGF